MKVFMSLAVALVAAVALSPAAAMDTKAIAPRRQPEPLTALENIAHSVRRLEDVLSASDNNEGATTTEETGAEGDNEEVLTVEATEAPTADAESDADAEPALKEEEEEVAPLIEPVSFKADSTSGSTDADEATAADAGRESVTDEENSAPADERRRNLRSL